MLGLKLINVSKRGHSNIVTATDWTTSEDYFKKTICQMNAFLTLYKY